MVSMLFSAENIHRAGWAALLLACGLFVNQPNLALGLLAVSIITIVLASLSKHATSLNDRAVALEAALLVAESAAKVRPRRSRFQRRRPLAH